MGLWMWAILIGVGWYVICYNGQRVEQHSYIH